MGHIYKLTCSINESKGRRRVSEYAYSIIIDDKGGSKLTSCLGHIYPAEAIEAGDYDKLIDTFSVLCKRSKAVACHVA